jgi:hypothetical protein
LMPTRCGWRTLTGMGRRSESGTQGSLMRLLSTGACACFASAWAGATRIVSS